MDGWAEERHENGEELATRWLCPACALIIRSRAAEPGVDPRDVGSPTLPPSSGPTSKQT